MAKASFKPSFIHFILESTFEDSEVVGKIPYVKYQPSSECQEDYFQRKYSHTSNILNDFAKGKKSIAWNVIPAPRLTRIWLDFGRTGLIRDEKGLDDIKDLMLDNIIKLEISCELMGHTRFISAEEIIAEHEVDIDLNDKDVAHRFYWEFFETKYGPVLSDYGLPKLLEIYPSIYMAKTAEQCAYAIDKALNVIHMRSDLCALFIEGGRTTLTKIGTQI
jgi:hypothetical protein